MPSVNLKYSQSLAWPAAGYHERNPWLLWRADYTTGIVFRNFEALKLNL